MDLIYQDGAVEKKVQIGAGDAHALARAIQQAQQARGGLRIAVDDRDVATEAEHEAMAEAEAEAALESSSREQR